MNDQSPKLIFVVGSASNKWPRPVERGVGFMIGLLQHNLRISNRKSWSFIDPSRLNHNWVRIANSQKWEPVNSDQKRKQLFSIFHDRYQAILAPFKTELAIRNQKFVQRKQYHLIKTWPQYTSNKNITGEWIISVSRSWFVTNEMIRTQSATRFRVLNQSKILTWASYVHDWVESKIKTLFHPNAFFASFLHLDESNVHLHCQHIQFLYKFNIRQQKMVHSFTRPQQMTPLYLSQMRQELYQHLNQKLKTDRYLWTTINRSHDPKSGIDLYRFKIASLQQQIKKLEQLIQNHRLQSNLQIDLANHRFNRDLIGQIQQLPQKNILKIYQNLLLAGYNQTFLQQQFWHFNNPIELVRDAERQRKIIFQNEHNLRSKIC